MWGVMGKSFVAETLWPLMTKGLKANTPRGKLQRTNSDPFSDYVHFRIFDSKISRKKWKLKKNLKMKRDWIFLLLLNIRAEKKENIPYMSCTQKYSKVSSKIYIIFNPLAVGRNLLVHFSFSNFPVDILQLTTLKM